ncbi:DUF1612 domain-containing protein [Mesorhizobium huakuii]|uniref:DUF1612 domain-containing protein n=1 Tax=Mesorhizobium huakuii TaxID=28104 RepID=UPI001FD25720|nr:DUF1612 domain-containing protein [Mesorhizobium huakuii]
MEVLQHAAWLRPPLVVALLRREGLAAHHLASLHLGAKNIPRKRRRARNRGDRLLALLDAIHDAAVAGLKEPFCAGKKPDGAARARNSPT